MENNRKLVDFDVHVCGGKIIKTQIPVKLRNGIEMMTAEGMSIIDDIKIKNLGADFVVTDKFLKNFKDRVCFVFGSSFHGKGYGGAASLRDNFNTFAFCTKCRPDNRDESFYKPSEYLAIYNSEIGKLKKFMDNNSYKFYLISKLGGGLANRFNIWEEVIGPRIREDLKDYVDKLVFLF